MESKLSTSHIVLVVGSLGNLSYTTTKTKRTIIGYDYNRKTTTKQNKNVHEIMDERNVFRTFQPAGLMVMTGELLVRENHGRQTSEVSRPTRGQFDFAILGLSPVCI